MKAALIILGGTLVLWALQAILIVKIFGMPANAAEFGNMFGFVSSFVSGIAFFIVAYTLKLQYDEIRIFRTQSFEERFFKLIDLFNSKSNGIKIEGSIGRDGFKLLRDDFLLRSGFGDTDYVERNSSDLIKHYKTLWRIHKNELDSYFKNLELVFQILTSKKGISDKTFDLYADILRAQFSEHEMDILTCHCKFLYDQDRASEFPKLMKRMKLFCSCKDHSCVGSVYIGIR